MKGSFAHRVFTIIMKSIPTSEAKTRMVRMQGLRGELGEREVIMNIRACPLPPLFHFV